MSGNIHGIGDLVLLEAKLDAFAHEVQRIDALVARLQHLNPHNTGDKIAVAMGEDYWRSSDRLKDQVIAFKGVVHLAQTNPFATLAGDGSKPYDRFETALGPYHHAYQAYINDVGLTATHDQLTRDEARARYHRQKAEPFKTWIVER